MTYDSEVLADSPVIYLKLDETSGTAAADSSGNGNSFTYPSGVTLGNLPGVSGGGYSAGVGGASAAVVRTSCPSSLYGSGYTLECWAYISSLSLSGILVGVGLTLNQGYGFGIGDGNTYANPGNRLVGIVANDHWNATTASAGGVGWHHYAYTRNGSTNTFYVDGAAVATGYAGGPYITPTRIDINTLGGSSFADGVALYSTDIGATRIAAHYAAGAIPPIVYSSSSTGAYIYQNAGLEIGAVSPDALATLYANVGMEIIDAQLASVYVYEGDVVGSRIHQGWGSVD
jgi:hypothetical protein